MTHGDKIIITVLAVAIVVVATALVVVNVQNEDTSDPIMDPVEVPVTDIPDDQSDQPKTNPETDVPATDPKPVSLYPVGITFDEENGILISEDEIDWIYIDELKPYTKREENPMSGTVLKLYPGLFTVKVSGETFNVIVDGIISDSYSWTYQYKGVKHDLSVEYDISIRELAESTLENRSWNSSTKHTFTELPRIVYVNDTFYSIEKQMETLYVEIGGSLEDRQGFADFLASFAQIAIKYPTRMGENNSTDYEIWGKDEYWANSLETLYYGKGDCEDAAAVACALFKSAGYDVAMVGVPGHVTAALSLDSFVECDIDDFRSYNNLYKSFTLATGTSAVDDSDKLYYGVETIKGLPLHDALPICTAGFYPVYDLGNGAESGIQLSL